MSRLIRPVALPPGEGPRWAPSAVRARDTTNVLLALSEELHRRIVHRAGVRARVTCDACGCLKLAPEACPGCRAARARKGARGAA